MAMKRDLPALLIAALLLVVSLPSAAVESCSALAEEKLLPGEMPQFPPDPKDRAAQVKEVQACLSIRGCYPGNPPRKQVVDGIVGPFTQSALDRSANELCEAPAEAEPAPADDRPAVEPVEEIDAPPCGDGHQWASWRLTDADLTAFGKLKEPLVPG